MRYVFTQDWLGATAGTRLFPQDGLYYFKTVTEHDTWLTEAFILAHPDRFRQITATEFMYGVRMVEGRVNEVKIIE